MDDAFVRSPKEVLEHFRVAESDGLTDLGVESALQKYGKNGRHTDPIRVAQHKLTVFSYTRGSAYAAMGAHSGTVQGPAGHHPPRFSWHILPLGDI